MLYFSELFGTKVFTFDKKYIGKLNDLLFLPLETPLIIKVVIKTTENKELIVPIQDIKKNGIGFILNSSYLTSEKTPDKEVSLLHTLQNQQIIDINGEKIIRVNDVIISDMPEYTISGVDIGVLGVFRWIGAANLVANITHRFGMRYKSKFIPWSDIQPNQIAKGRIILKKEQEKLERILPEDLAEHLERANIANVLKSLRVMDKDLSARVIADLNLDYQKEIFGRYSDKQAGHILSLIDPDESLDVLLALDREKRDAILMNIEKDKRDQIKFLMQHAKTPIGHLMSTNWIAVPADTMVKTAIDRIKKETEDFSDLHYLYVVNKENQIVGVLNMHELLLQKSDMLLYKVMNQNLVLGRLTTPKEIVLRRLLKYHLYAMPIVDENRNILGVVSLQDIAEVMIEGKT